MRIYVIDDDEIMAECVGRAARAGFSAKRSEDFSANGFCANEASADADGENSVEVLYFPNAIEAMQAMGEELPDLIFLDVLLDGPDGFTLLHELVSYPDTAAIPVVIISSLDLTEQDLSAYGVVKVLDKATMRPVEVRECVREFTQK